MRTRTFLIAFAAVWILCGLVPSMAAEKGDKQVSFGILYSSPTDDLVDAGQTTELDSAVGVQFAFEFLVTDRIGIEPALSSAGYDLSIVETGFPTENGDTDLLAATVRVNFHFVKESGLDLSVGPLAGYAFWDDIELDGFPTPVKTDDEALFGVNFGLDYPCGGSRWSFKFDLDYLFVEITPPGAAIGVDPIQATVGAAFNF